MVIVNEQYGSRHVFEAFHHGRCINVVEFGICGHAGKEERHHSHRAQPHFQIANLLRPPVMDQGQKIGELCHVFLGEYLLQCSTADDSGLETLERIVCAVESG